MNGWWLTPAETASADYQLTFEVIDNGRSLRVTRSISDENLRQPVVARSIYFKSSDRPDWNFRYANVNPPPRYQRRNLDVPDGTVVTATLNDDLSTRLAREGDPFTLTVESPYEYRGETIEGHIVAANRSRQVSGRAELTLDFDRIRLRDGRSADFAGNIESIHALNGENVRISEGAIQADTSQTNRTVTRTGVGAAIGAVIGAIAGGGKGAAIGAGVGAGAGAGSVFIQGADDLELTKGSEISIRVANHYD